MPGDLAVRLGCRLVADPRRVISKLFVPGEETPDSRSRARGVVARVMALDEDDVTALSSMVVAEYGERHNDLDMTLAAHFDVAAHDVAHPELLSPQRRMLLGAYFTHEFSPEAAALCNPSMAVHPDQSDLAAGQLRFIMTVRCIGEGHISSIGFRTGVVGPGSALSVDEPSRLLTTGRRRPGPYHRRVLVGRLGDLGYERDEAQLLLGDLPTTFTATELQDALGQVHQHILGRARGRRMVDRLHAIASSSYRLEFTPTSLSERLLWPTAPAERNGMEDARLVYVEEDGTYYATYVAYDGAATAVQLLTTNDFLTFEISPVAGRAARSKGLALFPRRVRGQYVALSRWDRENLALAYSDDCRIWDQVDTLRVPRNGWDLIQVGNGGSPIETPRGWLVITHGVGPMRQYGLGAILLDLDDPSTVVASLPTPLLTPNADERDGYVPNVVYTCGALLHDDTLTIPYGISDAAIGFAQVGLTDLLDRMVPDPQ